MISCLYIHIPFCRVICPFCAFPKVGGARASSDEDSYVTALGLEFSKYLAHWPQHFQSVYIGGGTPSSLSLQSWKSLFAMLGSKIDSATELCLEANPEDITPDKLNLWLDHGVNRISLGIESFEPQTLQVLGRGHGSTECHNALEQLKSSQLTNFNADLMYALPQCNSFADDLATLLSYEPPHISLYGLEVEPESLFYNQPKIRQFARNNPERGLDEYQLANSLLAQRGYVHYEVSNYCLSGYQGRQNLLVWNEKDYIGLGMGAHSRYGLLYWHNSKSLPDYLRMAHSHQEPLQFLERIGRRQLSLEKLMLGLRTKQGLDYEQWHDQFSDLYHRLSAEWLTKVQPYLQLVDGWLMPTELGMFNADGLAIEIASSIEISTAK